MVLKNVSIYLVNDKKAVLKAYRGYPAWYIKRVKAIPYPKGTTWKTIIESIPRYVRDASNDKVLGIAGKEVGTKSYLSMPINFNRKTIGCININSTQINAFDKDELILLDKVSKQIGMAIKNAKQAEDIEKSNNELMLLKDNLEMKVNERTSELRALTAHIQSIREEERKQISREIHDELGQDLTNLKIDIFMIVKDLNAKDEENIEVVINKINSVTKKIDNSLNTVRRIATQLRPSILDNLGLVAAIKWQLKEFEERTKINCEFKNSIKKLNYSQDTTTAIFRIFQEILTNIARHSKANKVKTKLSRNRNKLVLEVNDNGKGIDNKIIGKNKISRFVGNERKGKSLRWRSNN